MSHAALVFLSRTVGAGLMRLSTATLRKQMLGREHAETVIAEHGAVIYAVWHSRFWLPAALFGHEGTALLVSRSKDGDFIAAAAGALGYTAVRGSSSRGGSEALDALHAQLRAGGNVAVTPDGPRGPREKAKWGTVQLNRRSGVPVVPVGAACRPAHHFHSWDRFQLPWPWARGCVAFGPPWASDPAHTLEESAAALGERLSDCQETAEKALQE